MAAKTHRVSTTLLSIRREKVMLWRMLTLGGMQQRRRRINVKQTTNLAKGGARVGLELVFFTNRWKLKCNRGRIPQVDTVSSMVCGFMWCGCC